jgi:phage tail-like protein
MAVLAEVGVRADPVLSHNFIVSLLDSSDLVDSAVLSAIQDTAIGGFSECSGLEMSLEIEQYNEGGRNDHTLIFPTRVKWSNIVLKKGVGAGTALWDWHYSYVEGRGKRRDGLIILQNELRLPNNIWMFRRGLPVKYTGPTLNATGNQVAIESLEIAHEGLEQVPLIGFGAALGTLLAEGVT